jgi:hypothetical protein
MNQEDYRVCYCGTSYLPSEDSHMIVQTAYGWKCKESK